MLDVFKKDAYNLVSLTTAINKLPYSPSFLGNLGIFRTQGITTRTVVIEERDGILALLPTAARGTMPTVGRTGKRSVRSFVVPYIPENRAVYASEVQGLRAFGTEDQEEPVAQHVNDRLTNMRQNLELTMEWHRLGALQGNLLDADNASVIYNYFTEFGITQNVVNVDFTVFQTFAPPTAPTVAADAAAGNPNGNYYYALTFVTAQGETQYGTVSAQVNLAGKKGDLSAIPAGPSGVIAVNIYRSKAGGAAPSLYLVAQVPNGTATYTDNTSDANLGQLAPASNTTPGNVYQSQAVQDMKTVATGAIRLMQDALGMATWTKIGCICGNTFWDNFIKHPSVVHAFERWQDGPNGGAFFRDQAGAGNIAGFEFGDVTWWNYRGHIGNTYFVPPKTAIMFPIGVPDLFLCHYAPADFMETVNTIGKPVYAKQEPMRFNMGIELHSQSNPLHVLTRPGAVIQLVQVNP